MRMRIEAVDLIGADRTVDFEPGLNIITGPIASGKTTLIRLIRFLLGGSLGNLPPEAREAVTAVRGSALIGGDRYTILRPAVTTATARVEIAGDGETWRVPATSGGPTYVQWLLDRLDLPHLEVPAAPTRPESDRTPVSINDYWLYSYLSQEAIGFSVFGHRDTFKNIKRKYVFDIVYGFYDVEVAELQDQLRDVALRLRRLEAESNLFAEFFEDTALENRAALEHELTAVRQALAEVEDEAVRIARASHHPTDTSDLHAKALGLEEDLEKTKAAIAAEGAGIQNLGQLISQLESQRAKLTRAIVSGKHLNDIEFVVCPRCGSSVSANRSGHEEMCYLCLQPPSQSYSREALVNEQDAVEAQLVEAEDLMRERRERLGLLRASREELERDLAEARAELDFQTRTYVSDEAERIAEVAARRSTLKAREKQLREFLTVLKKLDDTHRRRAELSVRKERIESELAQVAERGDEALGRVRLLEDKFNEILERFQPPAFGEERTSAIDRTTYLPVYHGRRFDNLSSPGLGTLVNVAHALAHHIVALDLTLDLPAFLIIDGLSEHLGQVGLDPERLAAVYEFLIEVSDRRGDEFQIIVVDNEVPEEARSYIRLALSEEERLIPEEALERSETDG